MRFVRPLGARGMKYLDSGTTGHAKASGEPGKPCRESTFRFLGLNHKA